MKFNPLKHIGPGTLVAAAFIGPGTVTVCTRAGVQFGYALLWALLLSVIATIVLQEMAARMGLVAQQGLAEAIKNQLKANKYIQIAAVGLIIAAILIGNSAYQAGNISGGALGLTTIFPETTLEIGSFAFNYLPLCIGITAFLLLSAGNYKLIERSLVTLVLFMSFSFLLTAFLTAPNWKSVFSGLFLPHQPKGSLLTIIGLVGTTVVPYNLFLHASLVKEKWEGEDALKKARKDTIISIFAGGLVSMSIVVAAAAIQGTSVSNGADLARGLAPLYGEYARYFLGIGLFAAGITSAITAPLAAAYVARDCFGWDKQLNTPRFKAVWMIVLLIGVLVASFGKSPIEIIYFAQVANGILLPVIAVFLWWIVNQKAVMKTHTNSLVLNIIVGIIVSITVVLSVKTLYTLFG